MDEPSGVGVEPERPDSALIPRVATFFALYPETLGLEDGATFCVASSIPLRGLARTAMHLAEGKPPFWLDPRLSELVAVSVRFHRGRRDRHILREHDQMLMSVVRSITGESFPEPDSFADQPERSPEDEEPSGMSCTVVEMTTQLAVPRKGYFEACEPGGGVLGPTLTRCIDGLIQVIDAYRFAEKVSMPSPARERLGPGIVAATRAADPAQGGWDAPAEYWINAFGAHGFGFVVGTQTPQTFQTMARFLGQASLGDPLHPYLYLQAELENAMFHDGNFRAVLMFAHSASEVLMDIALTAMLFEEGRTPEEAVSSFATPLKTRILTEYHNRLGGAWGSKGSNTVAVWLRDVLLVRHRVAHAGYSPHYEEAEAAHRAYFSLGQHLRDRLAARAKRYPFTAGLLVRSGGFERRDIRTKAAQTAVQIADERLIEFVAWRNNLIQLRASDVPVKRRRLAEKLRRWVALSRHRSRR